MFCLFKLCSIVKVYCIGITFFWIFPKAHVYTLPGNYLPNYERVYHTIPMNFVMSQ